MTTVPARGGAGAPGGDGAGPTQEDLAAVEAYLQRSGLPHLQADYDPREDTLTRLRPYLVVLFVLSLALVLRPDWPWWARTLGVAAGLLIALAGLGVANVARGRPVRARPERVGFVETLVFVLAPAAADLVLGDELGRVLLIAAGSLAVAAVLYVLTALGVIAVLVDVGRASAAGLLHTFGVALRALPPVLAVLLFLFLAAEVWQAFGLVEGWRFGAVLTLFALLGIGFLLTALRRERAELAAPVPGESLASLAATTPAAGLVERGVSPATPALGRLASVNVTVALVVAVGARVVAVGAAVATFFLVFGLLLIREDVVASWTAAPPHVLVRLPFSDVVLTEQHVRVSVLLGGFAALYFCVVSLTDSRNREQFLDDVLDRLAAVMAAWAYYRGALAGTGTGAKLQTGP